jgi:hypothetical protein
MFVLATPEGSLDVYAASAERLLAPLEGREVTATGKVVDLSSEGFGVELWPAFVDG